MGDIRSTLSDAMRQTKQRDYVRKLMREPTASEADYFKGNPHVGGMASEDGAVVINPFSNLKDNEKEAVALNEAARLWIRNNPQQAPAFGLTDEQAATLGGNDYAKASESDRMATIAARILSGDPSAGKPTPEQDAYVREMRRRMFGD